MQNSGNHAPHAICGAKTRNGGTCKNPPVNGGRRCRMHGGAGMRGMENPNYKTGLYSRYAPFSVQEKVEAFLDADPLDLTHELALIRALLADFLTRYEGLRLDSSGIYLMNDLVNSIRRTVESIARIKNENALTAAEVTFLAARVVEIVGKYIHDPNQQDAFIQDLFAGFVPAGELPETINEGD